MSKLNRQLSMKDTHHRRAAPEPLSCVEVADTWSQLTPEFGMYALEATFRHQVQFGASKRHGMSPTDVVECARRALIGEVFGEFRQHFNAIYGALACQDYDKVLFELSRFEAEMFDISEGGTR